MSNLKYENISDHHAFHCCTFSKDEIIEIRHLYMNHADDLDELAAIIGVSNSTIRKYVSDLMEKYQENRGRKVYAHQI